MKKVLNNSLLSTATTVLWSLAVPTIGQDPGFGYTSTYGFGTAWDLRDLTNDTAFGFLGGLKFSPDGMSLCVVEDAEQDDASVYCFDVTRDLNDGTVTSLTPFATGPLDITDSNGETSTFLSNLDIGFSSQGPPEDGFFLDFVSFWHDNEIGLATWEYDPDDNKPTKLNIAHRMDIRNISTYGLYGLEFSNIVKDPNTGHGMLFAVGYDEMVAIPLLPNSPATGYYDIDDQHVQFLCKIPELYTGDMRIIKSGLYTNDFLLMDWDSRRIWILDIDETTGYPVGYVPDNPVSYNGTIPDNPLACPLTEFIDTNTTAPWGMVFDSRTGDFFFTEWSGSSAQLFRIRGFPPGFDPKVVAINLQEVFDAIFTLINSARRKLASPSNIRERILKPIKTKPPKAPKAPNPPPKKTKAPTPPPSAAPTPPPTPAPSAGPSVGPSAAPSAGPTEGGQEDSIPSTEETFDSLTNADGDLEVSPELQLSISILTDPGQDSFIISISSTSGTTSPTLIEKVETVEAVMDKVLADHPGIAEVNALVDYLKCLLNKLKNVANPLAASDCVKPEAVNP